ncbi:MAG: tetratricopeptide repeat protein [Bacteroidetes bacterium]|nr:tetratricopeptide repeat protein [Bacteroidota bacterium]
MAVKERTCPTCGSAVASEALFCDVCGEDLTTPHDAATPEEASTAPPTAGTVAPKRPASGSATERRSKSGGTRKPPGKAGKQGTPRGNTGTGPVLFSTAQWLAITLSAFILGGVLAATLMPTAGSGRMADGSGRMADGGAQQPAPQINLERLEAAKSAADANPGDLQVQLQYANELHDAMMLDQAIMQYEKYLAMDPDNPDARVDLGICYFEKQNFAAAIKEMERAVGQHPDHQLGTYNLGIVNLNAGNMDEARKWFTKARDMNPATPHAQNADRILNEHF